jgi:hypothetical protein
MHSVATTFSSRLRVIVAAREDPRGHKRSILAVVGNDSTVKSYCIHPRVYDQTIGRPRPANPTARLCVPLEMATPLHRPAGRRVASLLLFVAPSPFHGVQRCTCYDVGSAYSV